MYSSSFHQDLYKKINRCFSIFIPINRIPNFFSEEYIDIVIDDLLNIEHFEKSDTEIET